MIFWAGVCTMLSCILSYHWYDWASIHFDILGNLIALEVLLWIGHFTGAFHTSILRSDWCSYLANLKRSYRLCLQYRICIPNERQLRKWSLTSFARWNSSSLLEIVFALLILVYAPIVCRDQGHIIFFLNRFNWLILNNTFDKPEFHLHHLSLH